MRDPHLIPERSESQPVTQRAELMRLARKHCRLALVYAEDGAFATAAKMLREAAELLMDEHNRRQRVLQGLTEPK